MFRLSIHALLCLIVLVCPAMGGMCCDDERGLGASELSEAHSCCGCCCQHDDADDSEPPEQSHDRCQTCLCGGALPAGSTASDKIPDSTEVVEFVPLKLGETQTSTLFRSIAWRFDHAPPYGRLMLALHCALLL